MTRDEKKAAIARFNVQRTVRLAFFEPRPSDTAAIHAARDAITAARTAIWEAQADIERRDAVVRGEEVPEALYDAEDAARACLEELVQATYGPAPTVDPLPGGINPLEAFYSEEFVGGMTFKMDPFMALLRKRA